MKSLDYNFNFRSYKSTLWIFKQAVEGLENGKANISSNAGAPSSMGTNDIVIDTDNNRVYFNVDGTLKYATLT